MKGVGPNSQLQFVKSANNQLSVIQNKTATEPILQRPRPQVLEEEEYFTYLEEIIKRDYFPDLLKLEAFNNYQQKLQDGRLSESTARSARSIR